MPVAVQSEKVRQLVDENAAVEQIATGFTFTEGPIWMADGSLHFSDMPGDKRRRWHPDAGVSVLLELSRKCNGMTRDNDGNVIVCEHVTSSVVRESPDGRRDTIAYHWGGKYLNSPNDVIVASDGSIIFTDPTYGRMPGFGIERSQELDFQGVYRIPPGGGTEDLQLLVDDFKQPNGLCLSPDESLLYVNDTRQNLIRVWDVQPDGSVTNARLFHQLAGPEPGVADGMKVDTEGNVYCTGPAGVHVIAPDGSLLGRLKIPGHTTNMGWGDADWRGLYITTLSSVFRVRLGIPGIAVW